jgi:hypothetical protein
MIEAFLLVFDAQLLLSGTPDMMQHILPLAFSFLVTKTSASNLGTF